MKYIWIILMLFLILRSIRLLARRGETPERAGARVPAPSYGEDRWTESPSASEPGENGAQLTLPEYPPGWYERTAAGDTETGDTGTGFAAPEENTEVRGHARSPITNVYQESRGCSEKAAPVDGTAFPGELIKGMIWMQILDSRGGLQAKKRYQRYTNVPAAPWRG